MSKQQNIDLVGQVFKKRYEIKRKLKSGGFASVYSARDLEQKGRYVAVKVMEEKSKVYAEMEFKMYEKIKENNYTFGFVKHFDHGLENGKYFIVMQLLDKDLDELILSMKNRIFSLKTVLMLGLQVADRLEALHKIGYLHRDIKPDNLVIGFEERKTIIYLIDFGLAKRIEETRPEQKNKLMGSLGFMSCRAHEGKKTGVSDQIESLIYTMLFLLNGTLPWNKLQINSIAQTHKILLMKKKLSKSDFKGLNIPSQLFQILDKMKSTSVNEKVDYLLVKFKILQMLKSIKAENDFSFDWVNIKSISPDKTGPKRTVSPDKVQKVLEKQQNQKQIQGQIYQVYKFLDKTQNNRQKKQNITQRNGQKLKENFSKKQFSKGKIDNNHKNFNSQKEDIKKVRPSSALNTKRIDEKNSTANAFNKLTEMYAKMKVSGPNIVINKTAKHKI